MSRKQQVTYPLFVKTANDLKAEGIAPSVRLMREKIGGSNSTLVNYLQQWREEIALVASVGDDVISDVLKQVLVAEFGRVVQSSREKLEADLKQQQEQCKESTQLLEESENKIAELEKALQDHQEQSAKTILALEKQAAGFKERGLELERQIEKLDKKVEMLEEKLSEAREQAHQAQMRAAVAEAKLKS